jgi:hypothetical protein
MAIYNCISKPNNIFAEKFKESRKSEVGRLETDFNNFGVYQKKNEQKSKKGCPKIGTTS